MSSLRLNNKTVFFGAPFNQSFVMRLLLLVSIISFISTTVLAQKKFERGTQTL